jgi:hypothetical protein
MMTTRAALRWTRAFLGSLVLAAAASGPTQAQSPDSVWIAGTVVDPAGSPVDNAVVVLLPSGANARSDSAGFFLMRVPVGPGTLVIRRLGFAQFETAIELEAGRDRRFRVEMTAIPQRLDTVETRGRRSYRPPGAPVSMDDFYRRRAEGKGRTFTREEIERLGSVRAAIATVPGIRPTADGTGRLTSVAMTRCGGFNNRIVWFLDGLRTLAIPDLPDADIEAIEVYRGSSQLPPEAIGDACAAIFVWTRR